MCFIREAHDWEVGLLVDFFNLLYSFEVSSEEMDKIVWTLFYPLYAYSMRLLLLRMTITSLGRVFGEVTRLLKVKQCETADHLFLHCEFARALWNDFFSRVGIAWVMPGKVVIS